MIAVTPRPTWVVPVLAVGLVATSVVLLWTGHFITSHDVNGVQSRRWNYGRGDAAGLAAVLGAVISLVDRTARRLVGLVIVGFVAFLVVAGAVVPYLSFVGTNDSFGRLVWEVVLSIAAFVLLTPHWTRTRAPYEPGPRRRVLTAWARCALTLVVLVPSFPAFVLVGISVASSGHPECPGDGDACVEAYAGAFFGLVAFGILVLALVVLEIVRALVRRQRRLRAT